MALNIWATRGVTLDSGQNDQGVSFSSQWTGQRGQVYCWEWGQLKLYFRHSIENKHAPCQRFFFLSDQNSPQSTLPLVTWVPQSRLAFGHQRWVGWSSGLWPSVIIILQCAASLATGGYNWPCGPIKSLFSIETLPLSLILGPDYAAPSCSTVTVWVSTNYPTSRDWYRNKTRPSTITAE